MKGVLIIGLALGFIVVLLFALWCAIQAVSILSGKGFWTSLVLTIGLIVLLTIFSNILRGRPIITYVNNKNKRTLG